MVDLYLDMYARPRPCLGTRHLSPRFELLNEFVVRLRWVGGGLEVVLRELVVLSADARSDSRLACLLVRRRRRGSSWLVCCRSINLFVYILRMLGDKKR